MSPALTRRRLVQAAGAALGTAVAPIAASAAVLSADNRDAELYALLDHFTAVRTAWIEAGSPVEAAIARAEAAYPPRPAPLHVIGLDLTIQLGGSASGREARPEGGYHRFYTPNDVEKLRAGSPVTRWIITDDGTPATEREPDTRGEARRQAIIAAQDAWTRDMEVVDAAVGLTAAVAAEEAAGSALTAIETALTAHQPLTVAGLVRKGAWVANEIAREFVDVEGLGSTFARQVAAFQALT